MVQAGYIDYVIENDQSEEDKRILFDIYRRAKHIAERDEYLIALLNGLLINFPDEIGSFKMVLNLFLDDRVPDSDKQMLLSIYERFARK